MAQHDYVIANGTGAAVRSDINNGLAAIVSQNSGATEPATMYAYQWWADTTTGLLKIRNAANNAWITVGTLASANLGLLTSGSTLTAALGSASTPGITFTGDLNTGIYSPGADQVAISTNGSNRLHIASDGRVGIGTTSPGAALTLGDTSAESGIQLGDGADFTIKRNVASLGVRFNAGVDLNNYQFQVGGTEVLRIDSSGRLLVGTSTARAFSGHGGSHIQLEGTSYQTSTISLINNQNVGDGPYLLLGHSRGTSTGSSTIVNSGDQVGAIWFAGADGTNLVSAARIEAFIDGTPGANDMPGRLVFSTTADGASSPTERVRITSGGGVGIGVTPTLSYSDAIGVQLWGDAVTGGVGFFNATGQACILTNRKSSDGNLVSFAQDGTVEGVISVSGTTVTYGGGHLARWSQLPNDEDPSSILKGTVMSNLDEMCEWGEEDNEQLNKTKVSDLEGDPNVAGVFVSASPSDDGPLDFFCAMTGDMIIRIAESVTVQRGDLLMSAGDGTAKPQDDDIIRSKTIAKVTSTHVTCAYDDGSYCVPCVLMAC